MNADDDHHVESLLEELTTESPKHSSPQEPAQHTHIRRGTLVPLGSPVILGRQHAFGEGSAGKAFAVPSHANVDGQEYVLKVVEFDGAPSESLLSEARLHARPPPPRH